MVSLLLSFGFYLWPMLLVTSVIVALIVVSCTRLLRWRQRQHFDERVEAGINAILFWGVIVAVLGFLGQWTGLYKVAGVVREARVINPVAVATGLAQSLQTSLLGLAILLLAALAWFSLRIALRHLQASSPHPASDRP